MSKQFNLDISAGERLALTLYAAELAAERRGHLSASNLVRLACRTYIPDKILRKAAQSSGEKTRDLFAERVRGVGRP